MFGSSMCRRWASPRYYEHFLCNFRFSFRYTFFDDYEIDMDYDIVICKTVLLITTWYFVSIIHQFIIISTAVEPFNTFEQFCSRHSTPISVCSDVDFCSLLCRFVHRFGPNGIRLVVTTIQTKIPIWLLCIQKMPYPFARIRICDPVVWFLRSFDFDQNQKPVFNIIIIFGRINYVVSWVDRLD